MQWLERFGKHDGVVCDTRKKGTPNVWREVEEMLWVDHEGYFGPDRRRRHALRVRNRRAYDYATQPPALNSALRQLRMHVIEAHGRGLGPFIDRAKGVTVLAQMQGEPEAASMLSKVATTLGREPNRDFRPAIYDALDRVQGAMRKLH